LKACPRSLCGFQHKLKLKLIFFISNHIKCNVL
jgi:hypothetical protein